MEGCGEVNNDLAMESLVEETRLEVILMPLGIEMLTGKKPQNDTTTNSLVAVCCNGDWTDHLESSGDHLESSGAIVGPPPRKRVKRKIVDPPFSECDDNCITNMFFPHDAAVVVCPVCGQGIFIGQQKTMYWRQEALLCKIEEHEHGSRHSQGWFSFFIKKL